MYIREAGHTFTRIELEKIRKVYKKSFNEYKDEISKNFGAYTLNLSEEGIKMSKEIEETKKLIDNMSQIEMAKLYRFSEWGSIYFQSGEVNDYFMNKFDGMTPEISKAIGWG